MRNESEEVKEKVRKNVSGDLKICVRAVRKTRSGGLPIEAASERDIKMLRECKKFGALVPRFLFLMWRTI